jgi:chorismate mutase
VTARDTARADPALPSATVAATVRALRGATTVDEDTASHITERVAALITTLLERNDVDPDDLVSVLFTATPDLHSIFPATAARTVLPADVPLLGAVEVDVDGAVKQCIRVLVHLHTERSRAELRHVYLEGAQALRADLPG